MKRHKIFSEFGLYIFISVLQLASAQIEKTKIANPLLGRQNSKEETQTCQYRNLQLSPENFAVWTAYGCYSYTRSDLIVNPIGIFLCQFNGIILPVVNISNTCEYKFSIEDPVVQKAMENAFSNTNVYNRWLSCGQDAIACCKNHLLNKPPKAQHCSPVWDAWTCFTEYTKAGEDAEEVCPKYAYSGTPPQCNHYSVKTCFKNATWMDQTNYSTCAISPRLVTRTEWHISMLSISIIVGFPSLLILFLYKQLYTQKYVMIRNLIMAILCRNILVLISKSTIIMDELTNTNTTTIMANNYAGCRILTFSEKLATNFVFTCMLLEGIYLHQLLTNVFGTRRNSGEVKMIYYYISGASISIVAAVVWSILMGVSYNNNCWVVTDGNDLHWINDSIRLAMLFINTILLTHIVIVMWKTFRSKTNEDSPGLRTAKASLICLPLFGVPFLFIIFRPVTESCGWEQFYYFLSYALEGLQGIFVVIFHCYLDREVQRLLKRSFNSLQETLNFNRKQKRKSKYEDRRTTFSTYADSRPNIEPSTPITKNNDNNLYSQNILTPIETPKNVSIDLPNPHVENNQRVGNEPIYQNLPPIAIRGEPHIIPQVTHPDNQSSLPISDNNINNVNEFYVNDDNENIFNYYYNDIETPKNNNNSQVGQSNEFTDDVKLDPKVFFKNRANGIRFIDDDEQF